MTDPFIAAKVRGAVLALRRVAQQYRNKGSVPIEVLDAIADRLEGSTNEERPSETD